MNCRNVNNYIKDVDCLTENQPLIVRLTSWLIYFKKFNNKLMKLHKKLSTIALIDDNLLMMNFSHDPTVF